ncbi:MAG TPA: hypothetical protein VIV11_19055, partial [Kofleriaceae bacterium]
DEAACLGRATDTWTARACLPRMFPAAPVPKEGGATGGATGCAILVSRMRDAVMADVGSNGSAASAQLDKILPAIQAACEQDNWPKNVVQCVADTKRGDMTAFQTCSNQLPPELQARMTKRLEAVLQAQPPTQPPAAQPPGAQQQPPPVQPPGAKQQPTPTQPTPPQPTKPAPPTKPAQPLP